MLRTDGLRREALPRNDANIDRETRCNKSIRGFERAHANNINIIFCYYTNIHRQKRLMNYLTMGKRLFQHIYTHRSSQTLMKS